MELKIRVDEDALNEAIKDPEKAIAYLKELKQEVMKDFCDFNDYCKSKNLTYDIAAKFYSYLRRYVNWLPGDKYDDIQWDYQFHNFVKHGINMFYQ